MTKTDGIKDYIERNPFDGIGSKRDYFRKVAKEYDTTYETVRNIVARKGLVISKVVTNPNGGKTITESLRSKELVDTDEMDVIGVTTLAYGGQHVKYKPREYKTQDLIKSFENSVKSIISGAKKQKFKITKVKEKRMLRAITSDAHVGMDVSGGLFSYNYGKEQYLKSYDILFEDILKRRVIFGKMDVCTLEDLGDEHDGFNSKTVRGGHTLPQNMSNEEIFDTILNAKVDLIQKAIANDVANKYVIRLVVNDNHSGDAGLYIAKAVKLAINLVYSSELVEVDILRKFIEVRNYGKHTFLLTHGKDKEFMKSGLPVFLDAKARTLIDKYLDHWNIKNDYIHVNKGDKHQIGLSECNKYDYLSFRSLAPPSGWVSFNFSDSVAGFSTQVVSKNCQDIFQSNTLLTHYSNNYQQPT